jgi:DNA adenine methylase
VLSRVLAHLIDINDVRGGTYVEPYAGGAGAALNLLLGEHVDQILINDADVCLYAFWMAALWQTEAFLKLLRGTPLSVREWQRQRDVYLHPRQHPRLRVGFATFFLNRCNRSGIIGNGGPIGGISQRGQWKINARFNREDLEVRIRRVASYRERISVTNSDAVDFLKEHLAQLGPRSRYFVYLDPPYYGKGRDLYLSHYGPAEHAALARFVQDLGPHRWVLSYDDVPEIRSLYKGVRKTTFVLPYSARERRTGAELLFLSDNLNFPRSWAKVIPRSVMGSREHSRRARRRELELSKTRARSS